MIHSNFNRKKVADGQDQATINLQLITTTSRIANSQAVLANDCLIELINAQINLNVAANNMIIQYRPIMGSFTDTFHSFLTSIDTQFTQNILQLLNTYSPGIAVNFYMMSCSEFLIESTTPTVEYYTLQNLYYSKYFLPNATDCWSEYQNVTTQLYKKSSDNFLDLVQCQTSQVENRLRGVQTDIKGITQSFATLFADVAQNSTNAVSLLTQFVSG